MSSHSECARITMESIPGMMRVLRTDVREIAKAEFTVPQFRILNQLKRLESTTNSELAEWMGVSEPTMSRMVDCLVKRGMVLRTASRRDRRTLGLTLTPTGKKKTLKIHETLRGKLSRRFEKLSQTERQKITDGLTALKELLL